jgi:hypothetical protein
VTPSTQYLRCSCAVRYCNKLNNSQLLYGKRRKRVLYSVQCSTIFQNPHLAFCTDEEIRQVKRGYRYAVPVGPLSVPYCIYVNPTAGAAGGPPHTVPFCGWAEVPRGNRNGAASTIKPPPRNGRPGFVCWMSEQHQSSQQATGKVGLLSRSR